MHTTYATGCVARLYQPSPLMLHKAHLSHSIKGGLHQQLTQLNPLPRLDLLSQQRPAAAPGVLQYLDVAGHAEV